MNALVEGSSIRATCRLTGACKDAVLKLVRDMGTACAAHHNAAVRGVLTRRVQCDEVWSFCYAKAKNVPEEKKGTGAGDVWTWVAIEMCIRDRLRVFRCGAVLSLGGIVFGISSMWRPSPLRWHAPAAAIEQRLQVTGAFSSDWRRSSVAVRDHGR